MAHEENVNNLDHDDNCENEQKSVQQQLADANDEIAELKIQIAWLERSYE